VIIYKTAISWFSCLFEGYNVLESESAR